MTKEEFLNKLSTLLVEYEELRAYNSCIVGCHLTIIDGPTGKGRVTEYFEFDGEKMVNSKPIVYDIKTEFPSM